MDKLHRYYVYFVSNKNRTTFYVGVTNSIARRANEHAAGQGGGFTTKYNSQDHIYYESFNRIEDAIAREKQLKNWKRDWKLELIKSTNPSLKTLEPA